MKYFISLFFIFGLLLNLSSSFRGNDLFQVITSHPHDLHELAPHIDVVYENGRLLVVQLKVDAPSEVMKFLRPLKGHEKSYSYKGLWITNKSGRAKDSIRPYVSKLDKEEIKRDIEDLAAYKTRYAGTEDNQHAVNELSSRLISLGYKVEQVCYRTSVCSIIADSVGKTRPQEVIMVMAHIDSVGFSYAGADDNASGVAVLMEMARVIKDYSNKKTIRFFISNGEELGVLGSGHYARKLAEKDQLKELALVINMDMVGYNSNSIVELETETKFEGVARWFADLASRYTNLKTKITIGAWGGDHMPFLNRDVPTLMTIEDWDTKNPCFHLSCDTPEKLNVEYATEIGKLNLSAVLAKDAE